MYYLLLLELMPIIYLDSAAFTVSISFSFFFIILCDLLVCEKKCEKVQS